MNNTKRALAALVPAVAVLSVAVSAHAAVRQADPVQPIGPGTLTTLSHTYVALGSPAGVRRAARLSPNDALVVEAIHTDVWK